LHARTKCRIREWVVAIAAAGALLAAPPPAYAQFGGQSTISVAFTYTYNSGSPANYIIKTCAAGQLSTVSVPCIANVGQVSETVSYLWTSGCTSIASGLGFLELDGSNDGTNWFTLANGQALSTSSNTAGTLYSNGYYLYKRIAIIPCSSSSAVTVSGIYTAYAGTIPISLNPTQVAGAQVQNLSQLIKNIPGWSLVTGFQCYNENSATAFLIVTGGGTGSSSFEVGIPSHVSYNYAGAPVLILQSLIASSATAWSGGTVSGAIDCTFEVNTNGPFYPANPPSTF
jgi:hypothetical protein